MKKILLVLAVLSLSITSLGEEVLGNSRANLGNSFMQAFGMSETSVVAQDSDTGENAPGIGGSRGKGSIFIPKSHSFRTSKPFTPYTYGNN